jgi:two-component system, OmpR family, sensor kinase
VKFSFRSLSLLWTFTGTILIALVLGALLQAILVIAVVRPAALHWAESQAEILSRAGAEAVGRALKDNPAAPLDAILASVTRGHGPTALIYVDAAGQVRASDRGPGPRHLPRFDPGLEADLRRGPRRVRAHTPVNVDGRPMGEVWAFVPSAEAVRWPEGMPRPGILYFPVAAILAGCAGFVLFRSLAQRMQRLEEHAERVASGDFAARIPHPGSDEIGRLAQSLNRMSERLDAARKSIEEVEQQRRRFLADVTHELATPLTSIRGFAETLCDPEVPISPDERAVYLKDIQHEAERMDSMVADLLDLARLEGGAAGLDLSEVDWEGLSREAVRRFQPLYQEAGLSLAWVPQGESRPVAVRGDARRLEQVIGNLLQNALRYVPRDGAVRVFLESDAARACLIVEDTGPGFPEQDLPHVFDRFYRADPSRGSGGSGLGLSIVREIVKMHGGEVRAENRPSGGARLIVELPTV